MQTIEITSLPCVRFAHAYSAETYTNTLCRSKSCMEVTFVAEGSLRFRQGDTEVLAEKGDIICLLNSTIPIHVSSSAFHEHHSVFAELDYLPADTQTNGLYLPRLTSAQLNTQAAAQLIEQFIRDPLQFKDSATKSATKFLELLCEIDRCNRKIKKMNLPSEVLYTQRTKQYIHQNLHLPINQREIAEHLAISPQYLCSVFKKTEGVPIIKYINLQKMHAIRVLMEQEHIHLYEAAALFGYTDPNYVSRLFKKYYGYNITKKPGG